MSLLELVRISVGQVGIKPGSVKMLSSDDLATVTASGYLNATGNQLPVIDLAPSDVIECLYSYNSITDSGSLAFLQPAISNGVITLNVWSNPGNSGVLLPVVSGNIPIFNGTSGQIKDSGFAASDPTQTFLASIFNGGAFGVFNLAAFNDANGTLTDTGFNANNIQSVSNIKANRTANIGGGGAGVISVPIGGTPFNSTSILTGSINQSSNPVAIAKMTPTDTGFDILFTGDPGAVCTVNYIGFVGAQ